MYLQARVSCGCGGIVGSAVDEERDGVVSMISTLSAMAFAGTELLEISALSTEVALWIGRIQKVGKARETGGSACSPSSQGILDGHSEGRHVNVLDKILSG